MSRSRRHTPIIGVCADARTSEKKDKQIWHRVYRRHEKQAIHHGREMPHFREVSDDWGMRKDGKMWAADGGYFRRNPEKLMRK
jgi:hypothetical protein